MSELVALLRASPTSVDTSATGNQTPQEKQQRVPKTKRGSTRSDGITAAGGKTAKSKRGSARAEVEGIGARDGAGADDCYNSTPPDWPLR